MKTQSPFAQSSLENKLARLGESGRGVFALVALLLLASVALLSIAYAAAQPGADYDLTWSTVDGGGGASTQGDYTLAGTIGQPDARSVSSSGDYKLSGGFWYGQGRGPFPPPFYIYLPLALKNIIPVIVYSPPCGLANDFCEPYNEPGSAYGPLEPGVGYSAHPNDENDYYYFELFGSADTVTVRVTNYQADGQLLVRDGDLVVIGWDYEPRDQVADGIMQVVVDDLGAGKYYVQIYTGAEYYDEVTLYTLTVTY